MHDDALSLYLNAPPLGEIILHLLKYRVVDNAVCDIKIILDLVSDLLNATPTGAHLSECEQEIAALSVAALASLAPFLAVVMGHP
jgi:hypothetical protein